MQIYDVRPGIAYSVSKIAQRHEAPREHDMEALLQVVKYLYVTRDMALRLRAGDKAAAHTVVRLRGFADCGYTNHINGKSQYSNAWDIVDEDDCIDELNPIDLERSTGLICNRSWMPATVDL